MMTEDKEDEIEKFEYTTLVKINPKQSTLPIDTAAEWGETKTPRTNLEDLWWRSCKRR